MEKTELLKCGLDLVENMIYYLAKDAFGSSFLKEYYLTRSKQFEYVNKEKDNIILLKNGSETVRNDVNEIYNATNQNNEQLEDIYNAIAQLRNSVVGIEDNYRKYVSQFKVLMNKTVEITRLVDSIKNISEQTNLLSFNASIEAARAGNAGRGFRVIANEVKKLSDSTNNTSEQIKNTINSLSDAITSLEKETSVNSNSLGKLTSETNFALSKFDDMKKSNSKNNEKIETISSHINENLEAMNAMLEESHKLENSSQDSLKLFIKSASDNEALFGDLYSFVYQLKAVMEETKNSN